MNDSSFIVAKRDANKKALEQVEKATDSEPVKGKELLESDELKRKLSEAEERYRLGLSPKRRSPSHVSHFASKPVGKAGKGPTP